MKLKELINKHDLQKSFVDLIACKLKDRRQLRDAVQLFVEGKLSYDTIMTAKVDTIDVKAIKDLIQAREQAEAQCLKYWSDRANYLEGCNKYYSSEDAKRDIVAFGGYCIYEKDGVIVHVQREDGGNRQGGTVFEQSPYNPYFTRGWKSVVKNLRKIPELYEEVKYFVAQTDRKMQYHYNDFFDLGGGIWVDFKRFELTKPKKKDGLEYIELHSPSDEFVTSERRLLKLQRSGKIAAARGSLDNEYYKFAINERGQVILIREED